MWVNKSVNPSQTSNDARDRICGWLRHTHRAARGSPPQRTRRAIAPAQRGSRETPGKASSTDYPWRPGASAGRAFVASDRARTRSRPCGLQSSLAMLGLPQSQRHVQHQPASGHVLHAQAYSAAPRCAAPRSARALWRPSRGAVGPALWCWYCRKHIFVVESCLSLLFGVAPVARQKSRASWLRRRHILETPDRPLAAARLCIRRPRNPSCHVPFTGLGPVG